LGHIDGSVIEAIITPHSFGLELMPLGHDDIDKPSPSTKSCYRQFWP
jgi:hypothetical protein